MTSINSKHTPQRYARNFRMLRTIAALMLREMSTTYGRSAGGYIWAVIEPAAGIALLAFAFSLALRTPSLGSNFAIFYATGYLPFMMYLDISRKVAGSLSFSRPLLKYPGVIYTDAFLARFLLNSLTHFLIFILVTSGIRMFFDTNTSLDPAPILISLLLAASLGFGMGVLNCFLFSAFPVWERIWKILSRPLFILSTVLFTLEDIPEPFRNWLWFNPLVHVVGLMRTGFYPGYRAEYIDVIFVSFWLLSALLIGLFFLKLFYWRILNDL